MRSCGGWGWDRFLRMVLKVRIRVLILLRGYGGFLSRFGVKMVFKGRCRG